MKIHPKLKPFYEKYSSAPYCDDESEECVIFVSCGPEPGCEKPCKKCLFWSGYGLSDKEIQTWIKENTK